MTDPAPISDSIAPLPAECAGSGVSHGENGISALGFFRSRQRVFAFALKIRRSYVIIEQKTKGGKSIASCSKN